jgi:hypothetical protein
MTSMKLTGRVAKMCGISALAIFALALAGSRRAQAQTASVVFVAQITPTAGIAEPVRGLPIYLLRKSFAGIEDEAAASVPMPDMEKFIDTQNVSKELVAWMHQHHTVTLTGTEFARNLTAKEILNIPEFWQAYYEINAGTKTTGFPIPKYKESDRIHNPAKYQREVDEYHDKVTRFINLNPDSKEEMTEELRAIDPSPKWYDKLAARMATIQRIALDWAHSRYFVAQTQTDLNGRAEFVNVPAGAYWLSTLDIDGHVGDREEKWDVPVTVRVGESVQLVLSNYNAVVAKPLS